MKTAAFGALAVLMWTGPVSAQADDEHALRALIAGMDTGVEAPLTADAVVWNDGVAAPTSRGELPNALAGPLGASNRVNGRTATTVRQIRISSSGDMAYETSSYTTSWTRKDTGAAASSAGALLRVWRKIDGRWQVAAAFHQPYGRPDAGIVGGIVGGLAVSPPPPPQPMRVEGNIKPPTKTKHVSPVYPTIAQAARVEGVVILEATIGANGKVQEARVLRSIPLLDQAAIDAVKQWEFTPTLLNGVAVPVLVTVTVAFTLMKDTPAPTGDAPAAGVPK
jgi:TonB family protein